MAGVSTLRTARDRARSEITAEILATAREHLAVDGAAGLSLRAVARDLGLVSSAVYRYFENRDALLTALIIDSYDALGDAAEQSVAASSRRRPHDRWVLAAEAIRGWAIAHPHEYALLYGSPVPGYAAPQDTVVPGTRVSLALIGIIDDAWRAGRLVVPDPLAAPGKGRASSAVVQREVALLAATIGNGLPPSVLFAGLLAWTQLFGLLSFELFGQLEGVVGDRGAFFREAASATADRMGL